MKKPSIKERNFWYREILKKIFESEYEVWICNTLDSLSNYGYYDFKELSLFYPEELEGNAWIHEQLKLDTKKAKAKHKLKIANEYRIFILQLCIEMTNPSIRSK